MVGLLVVGTLVFLSGGAVGGRLMGLIRRYRNTRLTTVEKLFVKLLN
jgi:hypothetical protein